jgi:SAM-dependent methyltransferase
MRTPDRLRHPSRVLADDLIAHVFGTERFDWLDIGVLGMVDYERLRDRLNFRFTGADIAESALADARVYLRRLGDDLVLWDVEEPPPATLERRFDLVTMRHILNHCRHYADPLEHTAAVLRDGGRIMIILHRPLIEGPDRLVTHSDWRTPGEVHDNHYGREGFFHAFGRSFEPELWIRVDDGHKPNDVIVGRRRRGATVPGGLMPPMLRLAMPAGRRGIPLRAISRARLSMHLRLAHALERS